MDRYASYRWSLAWASASSPLFDKLISNKGKIKELVVGTHFYQTHPDFIGALRTCKQARFVPRPDGVFHPKIYLFENGPTDWSCVLGSPNFTLSALSKNVEVAVQLGSSSESQATYQHLCKTIRQHWVMGERWSAQELQNYRAIWKRQRPRLARLGGTYGNKPPKRPAVSVDLFGLTWREYSARVRRDEKIGIDERLEVLQKVGDYFHRDASFAEMTYTERRRIAGYGPERNPDWRAFGSMEGAGSFKGAIRRNDPDIARAIDAIPAAGPVVRQHYDQFVKYFSAALPVGGAVGTASRLLCMKRPDTFLCLDSRNRKLLCQEFGIKQSGMNYDRYWDEVIERVRDASWWNSPAPKKQPERALWNGRTAFLDSLFYVPK